ncbi:mutS domain V [Diplocarpon mali]|nr:mutS domain V [Diplocarpon mali]
MPLRSSTSQSYAFTSYQNSGSTSTSQTPYGTSTTPYGTRPSTVRPSSTFPSWPGTARPSSGRRSRSRAGSIIGGESQHIICALSEARGISPTVGLAFVNISTGEAVLSQICDNQFYARTINKLHVFDPTNILIVSTSGPPNPKSKMYSVVEENTVGSKIISVDRKYWSESAGLEYIQNLAFAEDVEAIKVSIGGNYFATCCFAAVLKYIDLNMSLTFAYHSLRIKYQPSEGSMMIDLSTIQSLELIQNLHNSKSRACLYGVMNHTMTPMGARLLRSNILQPSTQADVLEQRYDAVGELSTKDDMFFQLRQVFESLAGASTDLLIMIRENCKPEFLAQTMEYIKEVINEDVTYQKTPLDLRNQRTYASGVSGLLDVARQTFKETTEDVHQHVIEINQRYDMIAETRYDNARRYYLKLYESDFDGRDIPDILINRYRKKGCIECQTLDLVKLNQRIEGSYQEVVLMSDQTVQDLIDNIRGEIPALFRVCESIAMLDMITSFTHLVTTAEPQAEYSRPQIGDTFAVGSGRHSIKEKISRERFVPNDFYATHEQRFQIITGCNMSGKSTYIRSIALMSVMAQIGSFVPATHANFKLIHQLFARVSMDDCIEANVSTFASEMRETAFILRNIDENSLAIIDELGRGTSSRDGLAISLSIAEALVQSKALVFFATHFRELAQIMQNRLGVVNMHLEVDLSQGNAIKMLYKIKEGHVKEQHYGIAIARVVDLPPHVLEVAETVSKALEAQAEAKRQSSKARVLTKRRKLVCALRESLKTAASGQMENKALLSWIVRLQEEFIRRMDAIDNDAASSDIESETVNDEGDPPEANDGECEVEGRKNEK